MNYEAHEASFFVYDETRASVSVCNDSKHHGFVDHLSELTISTDSFETESVGEINLTNVLDKLGQVDSLYLPEDHEGEKWVSIGFRLVKALRRVGVRHRQLQAA